MTADLDSPRSPVASSPGSRSRQNPYQHAAQLSAVADVDAGLGPDRLFVSDATGIGRGALCHQPNDERQ